MTHTFGILGGGIAGTLIAHFLDSRDILIFDDGRADAGSRTPAALFHPFPGWSLRGNLWLREALDAALPVYEAWAEQCPQWVRSEPMVRPLEGRAGDRLLRSLSASGREQIAGVPVEHLSRERVQEEYGMEMREAGALRYGHSCSMVLEPLLREVTRSQGHRVEEEVIHVHRVANGWVLETPKGVYPVRQLILACGAAVSRWLPELNGHVERGQLVRLEGASAPALLSGGGVHWGPDATGLVLGATRWNPQTEPPISKEEAVQTMVRKAARWLPLSTGAASVWEGGRWVIPGSREPIARRIDGSTSVLVGLGSKGLLVGPLHAARLAAELKREVRA